MQIAFIMDSDIQVWTYGEINYFSLCLPWYYALPYQQQGAATAAENDRQEVLYSSHPMSLHLP